MRGFIFSGMTIMAVVVLAACGESERVPGSLQELNLPAERWSADQQRLAAKVVLHRSYMMDTALETAAKKGDTQLANVAFNSALDDFSIWHRAGMYADLGRPYRNCMLMLQNQVDAAKQVMGGGRLATDRIDAARNACRSDIG